MNANTDPETRKCPKCGHVAFTDEFIRDSPFCYYCTPMCHRCEREADPACRTRINGIDFDFCDDCANLTATYLAMGA